MNGVVDFDLGLLWCVCFIGVWEGFCDVVVVEVDCYGGIDVIFWKWERGGVVWINIGLN